MCVGSGAQAAAVINGMALVGADGDTLTTFGVDNIDDTVRIHKLFTSLEPVPVPAALWILGTGVCVLARRGVKRTTA